MTTLEPYMSSLLAAALILGGLILALMVYKILNRRISNSRGARLGVSEVYEIDKTRRLVLVRRDDVEHLVIIGGDHDIVVEQNIETGLTRPKTVAPIMPMPNNVQPMPLRPAPRPPVFGSTRAPLRSIDTAERSSEPLFNPRDPSA
jgi:Flagellar biosynthesis protein, FliO